jgi:hypothetical protein
MEVAPIRGFLKGFFFEPRSLPSIGKCRKNGNYLNGSSSQIWLYITYEVKNLHDFFFFFVTH